MKDCIVIEGNGCTARLYLGDNADVLLTLDNIGCVVTDPPYGIAHPTNFAERGRGNLAGCKDYGTPVWNNPHSNNYPVIVGDDKPFDPAPLLALGVPTCFWGGNWFADKLPPTGGWLVWDKDRPDTLDQATCELAWTNFVKGVRRFRHLWNGMMRASEREQNYHPTQKPVALYSWIFSLAWMPAGRILDPYMGSGPCGVAAMRAGRDYVGIEISEQYFRIAERRIRAEVAQRKMFI